MGHWTGTSDLNYKLKNNMKLNYKQGFILSAVLILSVAAFGFVYVSMTQKVFGNQFFFPQPAKTATATTSVNYMTVGKATTTVTYDSWGRSGSNQTDIGQTTGADEAILLVQLTASSTNTVLNITYEYSMDGIDWFQDNTFSMGTSSLASYLVATRNSFTWQYASSTVGGAAVAAGTATSTKAFTVPTPTRFVRAVLSLSGVASTASLNGAVWAAIVPKNQRPN